MRGCMTRVQDHAVRRSYERHIRQVSSPIYKRYSIWDCADGLYPLQPCHLCLGERGSLKIKVLREEIWLWAQLS